MLLDSLDQSWQKLLQEEFKKPYFIDLMKFVKEEYETETVYPSFSQIFRAFDPCHHDDVKVVILGQDPYHGEGQANGLCFSVNEGIKYPPSLRNIFKELYQDLSVPLPKSGNLDRWADQGVLLLNATLTVRAKNPGSHQKKGWEQFTDTVIQKISDEKEKVVFLLWGNYAKKKGSIIDREKHYVLEAPHPSPFSAHSGFFGSRHFSQANEYLKKAGKKTIDWS